MTATIEAPTLWRALPGWGIAADLTPPEIVNARQLKVLKKLMPAGLCVVLLICAIGYHLAQLKNSAAAETSEAVSARTAQLQLEARQYVEVTRIQGTVTQVETQIATLMTTDVELAALMKHLRSVLPPTMKINHEALTITAAAPAGAGVAPTGPARAGTISLGGSGHALTDLSTYVDRLGAIPGLVDVTPVSNLMTSTGSVFSLSINLTPAVLSHRFDVGKRATR